VCTFESTPRARGHAPTHARRTCKLVALTTRASILPLAAALGCAPVTPAPATPTATPTAPDNGRSGGLWNSTALYELAKYDDVQLGTREPSACSPTRPDDVKWRGILIQARSHVTLIPGRPAASGRFAVIPVCGLYMLDLLNLMGGQAMQFVITDAESRQVYRGPVIEVDDNPQAPNPDEKPIDPASLKGIATGSHFNLDATQYVALPARAATYQIAIEYGGSRSNTVTVVVASAAPPDDR
jgi:hypothetical protein